jgi:hypothetical protein
MNRRILLALGALAWSAAAVDASLHLLSGDLLPPAGMAAIFVGWIGLRAYQRTQAHAPELVTA